MNFRWAILVPLGLALSPPLASAQLVLLGRPTIKVESSEGRTTRLALTKKERQEVEVKIVRREGKYFWVSRENKRLVHSTSGAFHYFVALDGAGYVKIMDTGEVPEEMPTPGPRFLYMEHLSAGPSTITYWGVCGTFDPSIATSDRR